MAKAKPVEGGATSGNVAVVKKYANRRLYNTATSSYVTLEELSLMVREGHEFLVYDAKTGDDITRSVLTQIILEEDSKGRNLLPIAFLRQLIGYYDDQLHAFLPRYLELSMENFARHQDQMRDYVGQTLGRFFPINQFEDMARQNMALFQRAASMFKPPGTEDEDASGQAGAPHAPEAPPGRSADIGEEMKLLKGELEEMRRQISELGVKATRGDEPRGK